MGKAEGLRNYNEVQERLAGFHEEYPDGAILTDVVHTSIEGHIAVRARIYKTRPDGNEYEYLPDSTGLSWLKVPGSTNFTRGSELENAETSAVGRALAFIGFYAKGESLASKQEIAAKKGELADETGRPAPAPGDDDAAADEAESAVVGKTGLTDKQKGLLFAHLRKAGVPDEQRKDIVHTITGKWSTKQMTSDDLDAVLEFSTIETKDESDA